MIELLNKKLDEVKCDAEITYHKTFLNELEEINRLTKSSFRTKLEEEGCPFGPKHGHNQSLREAAMR
ncbi:hypothetical protein ABDI30_22080 [Paenibacillus cisolokensis]|uniref:hypothetical protein n=1 Tax=Paenibacillus cisolokensis TaxID=1658519 RepID=UPI003D2BE2A5